MHMREKNQVMRNANNQKMMIKYAKWPCFFILFTAMLTSLWGCAVTPQKLNIKGKPDAFVDGLDRVAFEAEDNYCGRTTRRL